MEFSSAEGSLPCSSPFPVQCDLIFAKENLLVDELLPVMFVLEGLPGKLMLLGQVQGGPQVKEGEEVLDKLRAAPELLLGIRLLTGHIFSKDLQNANTSSMICFTVTIKKTP